MLDERPSGVYICVHQDGNPNGANQMNTFLAIVIFLAVMFAIGAVVSPVAAVAACFIAVPAAAIGGVIYDRIADGRAMRA